MTYLKIKILALFLVLNVFWTVNIFAQENLNLNNVDKLTYHYYQQKEWNKLIDLGKKALKSDIDFYYLQYRMGIAYYSQKNYRKSIPFLENVSNRSPEDEVAKEYLYFAYLNSAQISDARKILLSLDRDHREKVSFYNSNNLFNSLGFEYKYYSFGEYNVSSEVTGNITQRTRNTMNYYSVDLFNFSEGNSNFFFNYSLITGENSIYDSTYSASIIDEKIKQHQFYFSWNTRISKGTNLKVGLTYMREISDWFGTISSGYGTGYGSGYGSGYGGGSGGSSSYYIPNNSENNFVGYLSLSKSIKNTDLSFGGSASNINDEVQFQPFISLKYYPFGNKFLYSNTSIIYQYNLFDTNKNNYIIKQNIGSNFNSKFSMNIFGMYGKAYNFIDNDGQIIYNSYDATNYWYGLNSNYYFSKHFQAYIELRNVMQTNEYEKYYNKMETEYELKSILVGLRFNF
ncbi:MAG: hypothetical protein ABFR62_05630 [Bacteroidota bacterium]